MRKILFFLLLLPAIAALGHDAYFFYQNQDKGFRLTDLGAFWDKYHKESHDQWKVKLQEITSSVDDMSSSVLPIVQETTEKVKDGVQADKPDYMQEFSQVDNKSGAQTKAPSAPQGLVQGNVSGLQKFIGFLLEQKAVFVFLAIALITYLLNLILSCLCAGKSSMDKVDKHKKKKGQYKYGRK